MESMGRLKGKKILVTGGTGFVASHLVKALIEKKAQVVVPFRSLDPASFLDFCRVRHEYNDRSILQLCVASLHWI